VSVGLARRLIANYTRPGGLVIDLTTGTHPTQTNPEPEPAALIITGWPAGPATPTGHLAGCAAALGQGGCVAVVLDTTQTPDLLGTLVTAARAAGLTYLQHIVIAHQLTPKPPTTHTHTGTGSSPGSGRRSGTRSGPASGPGSGRVGVHLRVHSDLLIFRAPRECSTS
jgi:hypothetical protein